MKIYIASKFENAPAVQRLRDALMAAGHEITYDWTLTQQWLDRAHVKEVAEKERQGVLAADLLIVLLPGGLGTHTEMGMALGAGKRVIVVYEWSLKVDFTPDMYPFYELKDVDKYGVINAPPEVTLPRYIAENIDRYAP